MPKYLCLQRSLSSSEASGEASSGAEMEEMYERFKAWREEFADNIDDAGGKLGVGALVTEAPETNESFTEVADLVGGYMILRAEDQGEAERVARDCPGLVGESSGVEIIEIHAG